MPSPANDVEPVLFDWPHPRRRSAPAALDMKGSPPARPGNLVRPLLLTFGSILEPDGGLQVRTRVLAENLAALGCPAAVVSTREPSPGLATPEWARSLAVPRRKTRARVALDLVRLTRAAASTSDVVIISDATLLPVLILAGVQLPLVWDTNECQSLHYGRMRPTLATRAKRIAWLGLERWAGRRCSVAIAIGNSEAEHWRRAHPGLGGKLVTVDHTPFVRSTGDAEGAETLQRLLGRRVEGPVLVFVGTMAAKHNGPAARWIVDILGPSLPAAVTVILCGPGTEALHGLPRGARVECLGMVDDVDSVIAAADICLAPLQSGAGVKTKVLHYLAHGRRVVGTGFAFEGLDGAPGLFEVPLDSIPDLVIRLLESGEPPSAAEQRVVAQRAWMERHHGRRRVATQWQEILQCLSTG